jgi:acyl-coenzyme A thioesterase PaaI-like protein
MVSMFDRKTPEAKLRRAFEETVPFNRVLGLKVESLDAEAPKLRFDMRPELIGNPHHQILHGGVIAGALDVAAGFAIHMAVIRSFPHSSKISWSQNGLENLSGRSRGARPR